MQTLIIPDVHGRLFWKDAVRGREDMDIIFLGDYIDPYPRENIDPSDAFIGLMEIVEFKRTHKDNVTLLLGNHDLGPYVYYSMPGCRTNDMQYEEISAFFEDEKDLFDIGTTRKRGDIIYTFVHSLISQSWVRRYATDLGVTSPVEVIDALNQYLHKPSIDETKFTRMLGRVSHERGGWDMVGSPVWADVHEIYPSEDYIDGIYQIFGHSQQVSDPIVTEHFACLDCRRAFILDDDGRIRELDGTIVEYNTPYWAAKFEDIKKNEENIKDNGNS